MPFLIELESIHENALYSRSSSLLVTQANFFDEEGKVKEDISKVEGGKKREKEVEERFQGKNGRIL